MKIVEEPHFSGLISDFPERILYFSHQDTEAQRKMIVRLLRAFAALCGNFENPEVSSRDSE